MIPAPRNVGGDAEQLSTGKQTGPGGDLMRSPRKNPPAPTPRKTRGLRQAEASAKLITHAIVEVLSGQRAANQLMPLVTPAVLSRVRHACAAANPTSSRLRHRIYALHIKHQGDAVMEVTAVLRNGARASVVAMRMELLEGRWRATILETDQHRMATRRSA